MRCPLCHVLIALTLLCNVLLLYYMWHLKSRPSGRPGPSPLLSPGVTVLVREFRTFEHGLANLQRSFLRARPALQILIASDVLPYPPVPTLRILRLHPSPERPASSVRLESHIHSRLVALVPDGTSLDPPDLLDRMARALREAPPEVRLIAAAAGGELRCLHLNVSLRDWTAEYRVGGAAGETCGAVSGSAVLLIRSRDLFDLPFPLSRPVQSAIFIQAALRGWRVKILEGATFPRTALPATDHGRWKADQAERAEEAGTMRALGIRLVRGPEGDRWYGCSKGTSRCFGTVVGETPEYLYEGQWTPPCCLRALRTTMAHVVKVLEANNVRYWLEGGSLLGAARLGDIIPWDYDVDVGIYLEDIALCAELRAAQGGALIDSEGFVWERAVEGDFFRVQYSQSNHLHVDLWPFYPRDGLMTRDSWTGHPQDIEFPESFLRPLRTLPFAGLVVQAPNNHLELLKLKFGEKAIEEPQYPNPALLSLSQR